MASILHRAALAACIAFLAASPASAQVQAGPGAWSERQTWAADTTYGDALTGYFYWPATAPQLAGKRALVRVLPGCGQSAAGDVIDGAADAGFNWKAVADRYGAVILAPNATGNMYGAHCWDWATADRSRNVGHSAVLLDLVGRFISDPRYAIDPRQVYVAGLSSGGAKTMVLGCQAPELFAGVGINAGPPPGVATSQIGWVPPGFTATRAADNCRTMAGANASHFASQLASVIWGTSDFLVAQAYGPLDAAAMRQVYGGAFTRGATMNLPNGGSNVPWFDAKGKTRTSEITVSGMGHAWPAGAGGQNGNFVDAARVDYPAFLMDFWFTNNLRVAPAACFACAAATTTNAAHVQAGRAYASGRYAFATGSHLVLGLNDAFHTSTLAHIAAGYHIVGNCP